MEEEERDPAPVVAEAETDKEFPEVPSSLLAENEDIYTREDNEIIPPAPIPIVGEDEHQQLDSSPAVFASEGERQQVEEEEKDPAPVVAEEQKQQQQMDSSLAIVEEERQMSSDPISANVFATPQKEGDADENEHAHLNVPVTESLFEDTPSEVRTVALRDTDEARVNGSVKRKLDFSAAVDPPPPPAVRRSERPAKKTKFADEVISGDPASIRRSSRNKK